MTTALFDAEFDVKTALSLLEDLKREKFADGDIYAMPLELVGVWAYVDVLMTDIKSAHENILKLKEA